MTSWNNTRFPCALVRPVAVSTSGRVSLGPSRDASQPAATLERMFTAGVYRSGFGGVRVEDTVVVTATGCRSLTHSPKEPVVVD